MIGQQLINMVVDEFERCGRKLPISLPEQHRPEIEKLLGYVTLGGQPYEEYTQLLNRELRARNLGFAVFGLMAFDDENCHVLENIGVTGLGVLTMTQLCALALLHFELENVSDLVETAIANDQEGEFWTEMLVASFIGDHPQISVEG